jgi:hypothetical protein
MAQKAPNHHISIDSETGIYWDGERKILSKKRITAYIAKPTAKRIRFGNCKNRGPQGLYFIVRSFLRAVVNTLGQDLSVDIRTRFPN